MSPTARTLDYLRKQGYIVDTCERWIPRTKIRKDLFGCIDVMAVGVGKAILAIQTTDGSNHSHRVAKIQALEYFPVLYHYFQIEVWSWAKRGEHKRWTLRRERVHLLPNSPRHTKD